MRRRADDSGRVPRFSACCSAADRRAIVEQRRRFTSVTASLNEFEILAEAERCGRNGFGYWETAVKLGDSPDVCRAYERGRAQRLAMA